MEKITSQKQIIIDYLKSTTSHPTVEEVYFEVRKKLPRISLGTVYRILASFKNNGKIIEIPYDVSHYDANILPHPHFICESCKRIFDVKSPNNKGRESLNEILVDCSKIGKVNSYQIYFYGKCKKCSKK
jgi:Fe2+ or Zn2+ uptake regulation protein